MSENGDYREYVREGETRKENIMSLEELLMHSLNNLTDEDVINAEKYIENNSVPEDVLESVHHKTAEPVVSHTAQSSSSALLQSPLNSAVPQCAALQNSSMSLQSPPPSSVAPSTCLPSSRGPPSAAESLQMTLSDLPLSFLSTATASSSGGPLATDVTPSTTSSLYEACGDFTVTSSSPTAGAVASNTVRMSGVSVLAGEDNNPNRLSTNKRFKGMTEEKAAKRRRKLNEEERKRQEVKSDALKRLAKLLPQGQEFSHHKVGSEIHTVETATHYILQMYQNINQLLGNPMPRGTATPDLGLRQEHRNCMSSGTTTTDLLSVCQRKPDDAYHSEVTSNTMNPSVFSGNDAYTYPANSIVNTSNTNAVFTLPVQTSQIQRSKHVQRYSSICEQYSTEF